MAEPPAATLPVLFTTYTPYPLPAQKFMIPASWKRYQLSQLVNKALSLSQPIPFDFILKKTGELLRGSLQEWSEATGVGTEETLEIEYVESLLPPTRIAGMPHDDWVSDVSCGMQGHFVTASYDGLLRVFDSSQSLVHTISGHDAAVTSVCTISSTPDGLGGSNDVIIASASHDRTARLTSYNPDSKTSQALASLHLHTSPISSIVSSPDGEHILTVGWDNLIGLWDSKVPSSDETDASSTDEPKSRKRQRLATENGSSEAKRKAPSAVLKSHTGRVTAAIFSSTNGKRAYSASLDATVRTWDIDTEICLHTHTVTEAPFLSLVHLSAPHLLAASSTDRTVRIIDTRTFTSTSSSLDVSPPIILQHANTPACLAASPTSSHHVASGGYDGIVRVWDVRSAKGAITSFRAGEGVDAEKRGDAKVLGLDWRSGVMAVAGEAGLDIWRVPERAEEAR